MKQINNTPQLALGFIPVIGFTYEDALGFIT
jgi:hypothetical protein